MKTRRLSWRDTTEFTFRVAKSVDGFVMSFSLKENLFYLGIIDLEYDG
jgi:hypothetical protein